MCFCLPFRASQFAQHLGTQYTAISMLTERVDVLQRYVAAVHAGKVPADHELLRQIKSLTSRCAPPSLTPPRMPQQKW